MKVYREAYQGVKPHVPLGKRIAYAPLGALLHLFSLLPFWLLYCLGDFLGFIAFHVVRYRRRIVRQNIADSFPNLSEKEVEKVAKGFYRQLGSYFFETIKMRTMSERQMRRHMSFSQPEIIDKYLNEGRDIVIYTSHFGNWEWITSISLWCKTADKAMFSHVYRPLKNVWFDRWWLTLRQRYNISIPMRNTLRQLLTWRRDGFNWITGFLSDQKPSHQGKSIEVDFLGRPTPFIYGTEELARKLNAVVLIFDTEYLRRGYYHSTIRVLTDDIASLPEGEVTRRYAENLSEQIRRSPATYLWSHNRWRLPRK